MFQHLFRKRGASTDRGFTVLEIAVAVGIVLLLSVAGIIGYGVIQRNGEIAAVEQAAGQGYTAAMSGAFTAAQIEADLTTEDITVSVYNLGQPYLFGASGGSGGLGIVGASRIMPAAVEHQEPCVVADGYDYRATRGGCEDFEDGTDPGAGEGGDEEDGYSPTIEINPTSTFVGQPVIVSGTGFAPEEDVEIGLDGYGYDATTADSKGEFSYEFTPFEPGYFIISATGFVSNSPAEMDLSVEEGEPGTGPGYEDGPGDDGNNGPGDGGNPGGGEGPDYGVDGDCSVGNICTAYFSISIMADDFSEDFASSTQASVSVYKQGKHLKDTSFNLIPGSARAVSWTDAAFVVGGSASYTLEISADGHSWTVEVNEWRESNLGNLIEARANTTVLYADGSYV